tara:strand:+ start:3250 stop:4557 length:1308 start_codon:yes stop_codon:yes gene_type:complete
MIPRYSTPEMTNIWSTNKKFEIWLKIEILACEIQEELGNIPPNTTKNIKSKAKFDERRILEIEKKTKHDVIAFLTNIAEYVGEDSKYIHLGLTSSDILDTCYSIQLLEASDLIIKRLETLLSSLMDKANKYKNLITIGRSHGIHAEPTTMGLKFAFAYSEFNRALKRTKLSRKEISICKMSGPVGTYSNISPKVEEYVAKKLGLQPELASSQIIPRDRHAVFFTNLSILAASIDRLATEIRHLQRTEVLEAEEYFEKGQKGSSAMPHKRNPVLSENLTGLSRYIRGVCSSSIENVVLWHERDISHSSVERIIGPDATIAMDFALKRLNEVVKNLIIYPVNVTNNLNKLRGLHFSQKIMLFLITKGLTREESYELVQSSAMKTWKKIGKKNGKSFLENLYSDDFIKKNIKKKQLASLFDNKSYIKQVDYTFRRIFG